MSLRSTIEWARSIDPDMVQEKLRHKAKCYVDMIVEKGTMVQHLTGKIDSYMSDIQEYLDQLEKINIKQPLPTKQLPLQEPVATVEEPIPLVEEPTLEDDKPHTEDKPKKSALIPDAVD